MTSQVKTPSRVVFTAAPVWKGKQKTRGNKASRTPGKLKGKNCKTDPIKKFFASNSKAYRHPDYGVWHEEFKRMNSGARNT